MTTSDLIHETLSALSANKVRTALTMLGIVIGISSVITMVSIGHGAQNSIEENIQAIGSNLIQIFPGAQRSFGYQVSTGRGASRTLTPGDADAIAKEVVGVAAVSPEISGRYQVNAKGANTNTQVVGAVPTYSTVHNIDIDQGSFISDQDVRNISKIAVIGPAVRDDLLGIDTDPIGSTIKISGVQFRVIGLTKSKGGTGFGNQDDIVYVPETTAQRFLLGDSRYLTAIAVSATDKSTMTQVQNDITTLLLGRHNIDDPIQADFNVFNQADIVAAASSVTGTFTILLGAVAGISLLVGGIGIMNMMLTTVTERTKEIGLRKAIGATRRDINIQFLAEAIVLTSAGGTIGIVLGSAAAYTVTRIGVLQTSVSVSSVLLAFGVSAAIGIVFGYYPARRASRLNPIEALRYE